jgi:Resolvase, N terminal domain
MRAALYARVSTHDQQTLGLQVEATAVYIEGRGWDLVRQRKDVGSGARERPGREGLLKAAGRREFDVVVVWRLNRWDVRHPPSGRGCQTPTFRKRRPRALRVRNDRRPRICAERATIVWVDPKVGVWLSHSVFLQWLKIHFVRSQGTPDTCDSLSM